MEPDQIEYFKKLLTEQLTKLIDEAQEGVSELTAESEHLPDAIDFASSESDRHFSLRMRDRERKLMLKIRAALARIEDESYGECVVCGEEIGIARLKARPVTTHCIDCKTEAETRERVRGY
jgi:DnaK suppressor protein